MARRPNDNAIWPWLVLLVAVLVFAAAAQRVSGAEGSYETGDVNCSGAVNAADAAIILQLDVGFIDFIPCEKGDADVNRDGWVTPVDAQLILQRGVECRKYD